MFYNLLNQLVLKIDLKQIFKRKDLVKELYEIHFYKVNNRMIMKASLE